MFDPSKLNLELDDSKEKTSPTPEEIKSELKKVEDTLVEPKVEVTEKKIERDNDSVDPLESKGEKQQKIQNSNDVLEKKEASVEEIFIKNDQEKDKVKAEERVKEEKEEAKEEENIIGDISDVINNNKKLSEIDSKISKKVGESSLIDINITSLEDVMDIIITDNYDLFLLEPRDDDVKVSFRKDKVEKDVKYIKFPVYNQILLKAKSAGKLQIDETQVSQEGKGEIQVKDKKYMVISKTVPSPFGEKLLFKMVELQKKLVKKGSQKTSIAKLFGFLGIIAIIALIIGGAFIGFIVMNAKTLEDVKFFSSLGINLNDINIFISKAINTIFSILIFIETIFLAIYLFKFFLTKKIYKNKKIAYAIFSLVILIITFSTGSAWMIIDKKISSLPNWQEMSYGDVQIYDNSKLISENFNKKSSLLQDTSQLIGPVTLKYDLSNWARKEEQQGFVIKRFLWNFGGIEREELTPVIIHQFSEKGAYDISVTIVGINIKGEEIEKVLENIQPVNVSNIVQVEENILESGGKTVQFDADDLKDLGKVEWYFIDKDTDSDTKPVHTGYNFQPSKIIFEDTLIGMYIRRNGKESEELDKIFIVTKKDKNSILGEIEFKQDIVNDLIYTLKVTNPDTDFGNGFIESFTWKIENNIVTKKSNLENVEESSEIEYTFKQYGEQKISVELKDSSGKVKTLKTTINVPKRLKLKSNLRISNNGEEIKDLRYENSNHEYFLDDLPAPTKLRLDGRLIRANNILYSLQSISWDTDGDGSSNKVGKAIDFNVDVEGNYTIEVTYNFVHRKIKGEKSSIKERIYIESIKKDAILDLKIEPDTNYVPTNVRFDASKSEVKGKNIEKFVYDYGDGIVEERDAINPSHKYILPGEYNIKLTVITTDGSDYTIVKKLVLKPQPQKVKIVSSMKRAPVNQGIDFSSDESEGQITDYYWDFGDGEVSTDANPSHYYETAGEYTVSLKVNFQNNNSLIDELDIEIVEDE